MKYDIDAISEKILKYLSKENKGMTVSAIARGIGISTATCSKYIFFLEIQGKVSVEKVGNAYYVQKR